MPFSGFPEFNTDELTGFDNNSYSGDSSAFCEFNWGLSNVAGSSQHYTGADIRGDLNNYPDFPSPLSAPTSLYPTHGEFSNEEYSFSFYRGIGVPCFSPQAATTPSPLPIYPHHDIHSPIPTFSQSSPSLPPESYTVPINSTRQSYVQPQIIPNPDDLGFDILTTAGSSSQPVVHPSPPHTPSYELWGQYSQSDPLHLDTSHPITGPTPPEITLPPPVASSSGPERTRQPAREGRRYDPVNSAAKKAGSKGDGWSQTLDRFRAQLDTLYSVHSGRPSGGLEPETALAETDKFVKEDLKRSPLRNREAGKGRRSRDVEDYLKGLLKVIRPAPIPAGAESNEDDTTVAALSRLADELEAKLVAVNQQPALIRSASTSRRGQRLGSEQTAKRARKNGSEKTRRDWERHHLERVSRLFRVPLHSWSKKGVLILAVIFLLYGPEAFLGDFIEVRPVALGL